MKSTSVFLIVLVLCSCKTKQRPEKCGWTPENNFTSLWYRDCMFISGRFEVLGQPDSAAKYKRLAEKFDSVLKYRLKHRLTLQNVLVRDSIP